VEINYRNGAIAIIAQEVSEFFAVASKASWEAYIDRGIELHHADRSMDMQRWNFTPFSKIRLVALAQFLPARIGHVLQPKAFGIIFAAWVAHRQQEEEWKTPKEMEAFGL
jgi:hypothetical protein